MKKFLLILLISILLNFIHLSVGYGQTNINIRAYVPETETNKNIKLPEAKQVKPTIKENKYQYFFEKVLFQSADKFQQAEQAHTIYDRIASQVWLWLIIIIAAIFVFLVIRFIDRYIFSRLKIWKKTHYQP